MAEATCLFSEGQHQVCGKPADDQVGIAKQAGDSCRRFQRASAVQLMVEVPHRSERCYSRGAAAGEPRQAPGMETLRVEHDARS
jgi:hypothetical protein